MTHRRVPLAVLGAAILIAAAACGGVGSDSPPEGGGGGESKGDTGSISTMGFGLPDEVAKSRVDTFKAAYPNVTVNINEGGFDAQQFLSAVASGNPPDLVYMDRDRVGTYAARGAIQPLDDCIAKSKINVADFREAAVKEVTIDGKMYGIPEFYQVRVILINAKAIKSAGVPAADVSTTDWDKLTDVTRKLYRGSGGKVGRIGFDPKLPEFLPMWAKANGADLVAPDGRPQLDDPKTIEALRYAVSLINLQGGWAQFKAFRDTWDVFGAKNQFVRDQAAAHPWENWYLNVLTDALPNVEITANPFTDRQGNPVGFVTGSTWAIPKGAKNPDAACNFMKVMTSTETWLKAGKARGDKVAADKAIFTGLFTGNKTADEQIKAQYVKPSGNAGFDTAIQKYYDALDYSFSVPASKAGAEIRDAATAAVNRVLSGQQDPAAALKQAQSEALKAFESAGG
jgi:multiple sugar transport system substrate-binding protein